MDKRKYGTGEPSAREGEKPRAFFKDQPATRPRGVSGLSASPNKDGLLFITLWFATGSPGKELNVVVEVCPQTVTVESHAACWFEVLRGTKVVARTTRYKEAVETYEGL